MTSGDDQVLLSERRGAVLVLTLNRPERRNALNRALRDALNQAFLDAARDETLRALVIAAADPAFCAGLDLTELTEAAPAVQRGDFIDALLAVEIPVIGAVNGPAVTGGLELALACDVLIAGERARFADTHSRVGVHPGWGMTVELPRAIGLPRARWMAFTGNYVDAPTAERWGLVAQVVPHEALLPTALEIAEGISELDPQVARAMRHMYRQAGGLAAAREGEREQFSAWIRTRAADRVATGRVREVIERGRAQR